MSQQDARRALKNTILLFGRMVVVLLLGLYTSRVLLQMLGFDDFGLYNVVGSVVVFLSFLNTAMTNATSRYLTYELGAGNRESVDRTFSMAVNTHLLLAGLLLVVMEAVGVWFVGHRLNIPAGREVAAQWCFQFSLLLFVAQVVRVPFHSNVIAHEQMNFYAFASVGEAVLKLGVVLLLAHASVDRLIFYSALLAVASIMILAGYMVYNRRVLNDVHYIRYWDGGMIKKFVAYSGYSMLVNGADGMTVQCRNVFFNWFVGTLANAAMGVANQVIGLFNVFVDTFSQSFRPQIIKSYAAGDRGYFMQIIFSSSKMSHYLFLMISIPVLLNLEFLLRLWLGEYPPLTVPFVMAIFVFTIFDVFQMPLVTAVHATGRLRTHQTMIAAIKILAIPLTYTALRMGYSAELTLYLWAGLNVVCAAVRTVYMKRLIGLPLRRYLTDVLVRMAVVTVLCVPLPYWLSTLTEGWLRLVVSTVAAVVMVAAAGFLVGIDRRERQFLLALGPVQQAMALARRK